MYIHPSYLFRKYDARSNRKILDLKVGKQIILNKIVTNSYKCMNLISCSYDSVSLFENKQPGGST